MATITLAPGWGMKKTLRYNTIPQETAAMQANVYVSTMETPLWDFTLSIPYLSGRIDDPNSSIAGLVGLFANAKGGAGTFTFMDPRDHAVTNYQFGTGDGSSKVWQLTRPLGAASEWVQNIVGTPSIYNNGTLVTSGYSIDEKGIISFDSAPANGHALSWSGDFQYLLRFKTDSLQDLTLFFEGAWTISTLEFESVIR